MTLWFEFAIAVLLSLAILWAKPEYGLFLYGLALGFPDVALPLGAAINVRMDDCLILVFLLRTIMWTPAPLAPGQRKILGAQMYFFAACLLSAAVGVLRGNPPAAYDTAKMIGCAAIALVLPQIVQSHRRLWFFLMGLMCAGIALVIQIHQRMGSSSTNGFANFQELKNAATFTTWNANTIGQAAMLLVFSAGLGGVIFSTSRSFGVIWPGLALGFALIPLLVFVRGTCISLALGSALFLCLVRRWKWVFVFIALCFSAFLYVHTVNRALVEGATRVDLFSTGEGLSHRFDRWQVAGEAIEAQPLFGQGFGQEWNYMSAAGSEGRAHNAFLTMWLELGLCGLALFLAFVYQFALVGWTLYRNAQSQMCGALILALMFTLCIDSFGLPTLYWEKLPVIALSVAVAVAGICERNESDTFTPNVDTLNMNSVPQHS